MKSVLKAALAAAVALGTAQVASAESIDKTLAADPRGAVEISNVSGSIRVIGWERADVQVTGEYEGDVERIDFKRDGDRVYVKVVPRNGRNRKVDADLTIRVPQESRVDVNTVSAEQEVENVRGAQRLLTVSGDLNTQVGGGELVAQSVSGDIVAKSNASADKGRKARTRVSSVSGSIMVENLGDDVEAESVSGDVMVRSQSLTRARVKTTNGSIRLTAGLAKDAQIDAESINGDFSLQIEGAVDAEFDIETFNGKIDNCFGPQAKRTHEYGPGRELHFKEGEGRGRVRIKTLNGGVNVCKNPRTAATDEERKRIAAACAVDLQPLHGRRGVFAI